MTEVVRAVDRGLDARRRLQRAARGRRRAEPPSRPASSCARCASSDGVSLGFQRAVRALPEAPAARGVSGRRIELARSAVRLRREQGLLVVGIDLAAQERATPPRPPQGLPVRATRPSSARPSTRARPTAPSPSSRRSASCTPTGSVTGPGSSTRARSRARSSAIATATSNIGRVHRRPAHHDGGLPHLQPADRPGAGRRQPTIPSAEMRKLRLSTTFCTDNRLVSHTTVQPGDRPRRAGLRLHAPRAPGHRHLRVQAQLLPGQLPREARLRPPDIDFTDRLLAQAGYPLGAEPELA